MFMQTYVRNTFIIAAFFKKSTGIYRKTSYPNELITVHMVWKTLIYN